MTRWHTFHEEFPTVYSVTGLMCDSMGTKGVQEATRRPEPPLCMPSGYYRTGRSTGTMYIGPGHNTALRRRVAKFCDCFPVQILHLLQIFEMRRRNAVLWPGPYRPTQHDMVGADNLHHRSHTFRDHNCHMLPHTHILPSFHTRSTRPRYLVVSCLPLPYTYICIFIPYITVKLRPP